MEIIFNLSPAEYFKEIDRQTMDSKAGTFLGIKLGRIKFKMEIYYELA